MMPATVTSRPSPVTSPTASSSKMENVLPTSRESSIASFSLTSTPSSESASSSCPSRVRIVMKSEKASGCSGTMMSMRCWLMSAPSPETDCACLFAAASQVKSPEASSLTRCSTWDFSSGVQSESIRTMVL